MVFSLVYVSAAVAGLTLAELDDLVAQSRLRNAATDITGLLLYRSGAFLQLLEGSQAAVETLYASIRNDHRHHDVVTVRERHQPDRQFTSWAMGFGNVDPSHGGAVEVSSPPPDGPVAQTEAEATLIRELLEIFDPD